MSERESRLSNSQMLSQVASVLVAAALPLVVFAVDKRELGILFWILLALGVTALVLSGILGGRGIATIDKPGRLFDHQAKSCLAGILLLATCLFFLGEPRSDNVTESLNSLHERMGGISARLDGFEADIAAVRDGEVSMAREISAIRTDLASIREELQGVADE